MKYFIDTEFIFDIGNGGLPNIDIISLALVAEDGRELYLISDGFGPPSDSDYKEFIDNHVIANLHSPDGETVNLYYWMFRISDFVGDDLEPEWWGDYAAFDYVILSTAMGGFANWPSHWPMWIKDNQNLGLPVLPAETPHNALSDARALYKSFMRAKAITAKHFPSMTEPFAIGYDPAYDAVVLLQGDADE